VQSKNRFVTLVLGLGVAVLLAAILLGEHMGDRVLTEAAESGSASAPPMVTPVPQSTDGPYSPDWKNTQVLAAATDPNFPDPRVPPKPLPTAATATPNPSPTAQWTANPNLPIWDQTRPPSPSAEPTTFSSDSTGASESPSPSPEPSKKCRGVLRLLKNAGVAHSC
jgi:hypothetical protein